MSPRSLPVPRLHPHGGDVLEERARALAVGDGAGAEERGALQVVTFRLGEVRCAIDAALVERAVARLGAVVAVPLAAGGERAVAFVNERPVPVLDLAGFVEGAPRAPARLVGKPGLVLAVQDRSVGVVVDGPLELAEEALAGSAPVEEGARIQITGRLVGGATLLDPAWVLSWAGKASA